MSSRTQPGIPTKPVTPNSNLSQGKNCHPERSEASAERSRGMTLRLPTARLEHGSLPHPALSQKQTVLHSYVQQPGSRASPARRHGLAQDVSPGNALKKLQPRRGDTTARNKSRSYTSMIINIDKNRSKRSSPSHPRPVFPLPPLPTTAPPPKRPPASPKPRSPLAGRQPPAV